MSAPVRLEVRQNTDEWLAMRRTGIGSSDMPVITGNRTGLVELWAEKAGMAPRPPIDPATQLMFDVGHLLEDDLAELYARPSEQGGAGRPVKRVNQMLRHPEIEWAFASLDRVSAVKGERRAIELKWAPNRRWSESPETVPAEYQDQIQWAHLVTGYEVTDIAVLEGSRFQIYEVGRDDGYIADLLYLAKWFRDLVAKREMPPLDGSASTHRTLRRLYPYAGGDVELLVGEDPVWDDIARRWQEAEAAEKAARAEMSLIKAAARQLIAEGTGVQSEPGGYLITLKNTRSIDWKAVAEEVEAGLADDVEAARFAELIEENTHTDWQAICKTLRVRPKVIDAHATPDGPRRFHTRFKAAPAADVVPGEAEEQEEIAA